MRPLLLSILAVVTLALAGCGADFDTDQMRLCRQAIPPLNPPNARIEIERTTKGPVPRALRLLYRVQLGDGLSEAVVAVAQRFQAALKPPADAQTGEKQHAEQAVQGQCGERHGLVSFAGGLDRRLGGVTG